MKRKCGSCGRAVEPGSTRTHYSKGGVFPVGSTTSYQCSCGAQFDITSSGRVALFFIGGVGNVAISLWAWVTFAPPMALLGLLLGLGLLGWSMSMLLPARANPPISETDRP